MKPSDKSKSGMTLDLISNASDLNWMYTGRLWMKAKAGDKAAQRELEELENTPVYSFKVSPLVEPKKKPRVILSRARLMGKSEEIPIEEIVETGKDYSAEFQRLFGKEPKK